MDRACFQMQMDFALKVLMDKENERLRKRLFDKSKKPSKKTSGHARHMTSDEMLDALARGEWASKMAEVFKQRVFKQRKKAYEKWCREMAAQEKAQEKEVERAQKEVEKEEERRRKDVEKTHEQDRKRRERERVKALKDGAKLQKAADLAAAKAEKARLVAERQSAGRALKRKATTRRVVEPEGASEEREDTYLDEGSTDQSIDQPAGPPIPAPERPRPRAIQRQPTPHSAPSFADHAPPAASVATSDAEVMVLVMPTEPHVPVSTRPRPRPKQPPVPANGVEPVVRRSTRRK